MESKLAKTADEPHSIPDPSADDSFSMNGRALGSTGTPRSSITVLHATPEMQRTYSHWMASKTFVQLAGVDAGTTSDAAQPPETPDGPWWEATLPVAGRNLVPSMPSVLAGFTFIELRGVPKEGLDHFVLATSCNGKPLYGGYVMGSNGVPRMQQLFEFSQTARDAGMFLPVPTAGGHFQGVYGIDYIRHRVCGSIASLPGLLRCPAPPTSVGLTQTPEVRRGLLEVAKRSATADTPPAKPISDEVNDSSMGPLPSPMQGETPDPRAVSSLVTLPLRTHAQSSNEIRHALDEVPLSLSKAPAPAPPSSTCKHVTPLIFCATPLQEEPSESDKSTFSAPAPVVTALSALSKPLPKHLPEYCHPCSLCTACKKFWGINGLPEEYFKDDLFHWRKDDGDIAILSSARTAMKKRKWNQSRHGPKSKTSEYRGVNLYKRTWKWEAHIWFMREQLYLGASLTKIHAAKVYDRAALFLFGPDAAINFKPEEYQQEYEFMQRLTFGQMVFYLRRESRQNGEEVRYPGVSKVKGGLFSAKYRPNKSKASQELIGQFRTQDEAVRAVLQEAHRRQNFDLAEDIMDIHHLRTVKPAPGKFTVKRRARAVCIMAALKVMGVDPFMKTPARARRAATSKPSTKADADEFPAQEAEAPRPKRQRAKRTRKAGIKAKAAAAEKAAADTAPAPPVSQEAPPSQETKPTPPKRKYKPRKTNAHEKEKCVPKRGAKRALPTEDSVAPAPVTEAVEASPCQDTKATPPKRKYTPRKTKAQEKCDPKNTKDQEESDPKNTKAQEKSAPKGGTKRALPAQEVAEPAPFAEAVKAPTCQDIKATPPKRNYTPRKTKTQEKCDPKNTKDQEESDPKNTKAQEKCDPKNTKDQEESDPKNTKAQEKSAPKGGTKRALPTQEVAEPAPFAETVIAPPRKLKIKAAARSKNSTRSTSPPAAKKKNILEATSPPAARKCARASAAVPPLPRSQNEAEVQESIAVGPAAPSASTALPTKNRRGRRTTRRPTRYVAVASIDVLPTATPQRETVALRLPTSPEQFTIPIADSLTDNEIQPPEASESMSGSMRGAQMLLDCAGMYASSSYTGSEPPSFLDSQSSGYASSSCISFQSPPVSKRSRASNQQPHQVQVEAEQPQDDAMRQYQRVCDWLVMQRRCQHAPLPWSGETSSPAVIRPVARRLPTTNWAPQAAVSASDAASGALCSADVIHRGKEKAGQLYVDLFQRNALRKPSQ